MNSPLRNNILFSVVCVFIFQIYSAAQELPEQYREKFSDSYHIRLEQNSDMNRYLDNLIEASVEKRFAFFKPDYSGTEQYRKSLVPYREELSEMLSYPPPGIKEGTVPKIEFVGEDSQCRIYRVWLEVLNGVKAYGIYMVPRNLKGKAPLLIIVHGSGGCPEAVCDLDTGKPLHAMGREAVKKGYIVWAPALDVRNYYGNEEKLPESNRHVFSRKAVLVGTTFKAIDVYKIIRSTNALIENRREIDADKVGMTGLSLGGYFTMYTTALFPRIKAAAPSAYYVEAAESSRRAAIGEARDAFDKNLINKFGFAQLAGMICPRPLMIQLGKNDKAFNTEASRREIDKSEIYYRKLGIKENLKFFEHSGGHEYHPESILSFFDKILK